MGGLGARLTHEFQPSASPACSVGAEDESSRAHPSPGLAEVSHLTSATAIRACSGFVPPQLPLDYSTQAEQEQKHVTSSANKVAEKQLEVNRVYIKKHYRYSNVLLIINR